MIKKSILGYYGGKHYHADWIIKHFPKNYRAMHYAEPFAGGLSVLFKKDKSQLESINDKWNLLMNFWEVIRDKEMSKELFDILKYELHSEKQYRDSMEILKKFAPKNKSEKVKMAFHYFYINMFAFSGAGNPEQSSGWAFIRTNFHSNKISRKFHKKVFNINNYHLRLKEVQIFCRDAISVIERLDHPNTLFYLDPPYPMADQKAYAFKYGEKEFNDLVDLLKSIKGKFLMSFYRKKFMEFPKDWILSYKKTMIRTNLGEMKDKDVRRIETLVRNYEL